MTHPDIKLSRPDGFWKTGGIDDCSGKIEKSHRYKRSKCRKVHCLVITVSYYVMNYRNTTTQSECHESPYIKHISITLSHDLILTLHSLM